MNIQTGRRIAIVLLIVVVFGYLLPLIAIYHFTGRDGAPGAAFTFFVAICLPAATFIAANLSIQHWRQLEGTNTTAWVAWVSIGLLILCVIYLAGFFSMVAFVWKQEVQESVPGFQQPVTKDIRYPIDEGLNLIATYFGTFLVWVLSLEIFSLRGAK